MSDSEASDDNLHSVIPTCIQQQCEDDDDDDDDSLDHAEEALCEKEAK